jgi:uncharacterized protein (TIGR03083 family)
VQLRPRYDGAPILRVEAPLPNPAIATLRQRRRLVKVLGELDEPAWGTPSRCQGWSVQDVATHLVSVNQFWAFSVNQGVAGTPTRFLATFDPVASPAEMVEGARGKPAAETLRELTDSVEALAAAVEPLTDEQVRTVVAESPPGHVTVDALLLHALWDGWIHERDILLPLGRPQDREEDELVGCLTYAAVLGPAFAAMAGTAGVATFVVEATDPSLQYVVRSGETATVSTGEPPPDAPVLQGDAVELIEALSFRAPFPHELDGTIRTLVAGLGDVFDTEVR